MKKIKSTVNRKTVINTGILFIIACFINFYLTNKTVFTGVPNIHDTYRTLLSFSTKLAAVSIIILSVYTGANFTKKFSLKMAVSVMIYLVVNYSIVITRNLNNKAFLPADFVKNNFFQSSGLVVIAIILIISLLIKLIIELLKNERLKNIFLFSEESCRSNYLVGLLISILFFRDDNLRTIIQFLIPDLTDSTFNNQYLIDISKVTILITFIIIFIIYCLLRTFSDIKQLNSSLSLSFITSLSLALIFNYSLQYGVKTDTDLLGRYIFPGATTYQIFILTILFLLIYLVFNRYLFSTLFILIIGTAATVANLLKEKMRSEPLLVTDLTWLKEIKLVISFVDEKIIIYIVLTIVAIVAFYFIVKKFVKTTPILSNLKTRIAILFLLGAILFQIFIVFKNEEDKKIQSNIPVISTLNNYLNIEWMGFDVNARYKSLTYVWTKQLTKRIMEKPKDYNKRNVLKIVKKYRNEAEKINKNRENQINSQTVIYVLSESLSNPNRIENVTLSKDLIPNIDQVKSSTTSGLMQSDGYGGGTANMEFESLTGLPFYNFNTGVSTLYTEVLPKMSKVPVISDQFKKSNRIVMHPSLASNYSRYQVYERLGFTKLFFTEGGNEKFKNLGNVGVNMGDSTLYKNILREINPKKNQFFSIITMQNHAPWSIPEPTDISATGTGFSTTENDYLVNYSRLLTHTDKSTKEFLDELEKIDKEITVVFYGDHLPGLYPDSAFKNNPKSQYRTDYFIWSNHRSNSLNYPLVNSSDFTAELLEHTNSKVSPYYALLTQVLKEASVDKENLNSNQEEIANDLKIIQYDLTLGENYLRKQNFFKIGE